MSPNFKRSVSVPRVCGGCGWGPFCRELVPPLCFATSGCSCVRSSMRFLKLWWQIALEWRHECCMGYVLGRKPEHETLCFSVSSGCSRRWKVPRVCGGCGWVRFCRELVPPLCSATSVAPACVVLCVSWICGGMSHWNGCMIVVIWCCHVHRYVQVCDIMLQKTLYNGCVKVAWHRGCMRNTITILFCSWTS